MSVLGTGDGIRPRPALRVRVDLGRCTGRGDCAGIAPAVFLLDRYGYPIVADFDQDDPEARTLIREAQARCPEGAIHVDELDGASPVRGSGPTTKGKP